MYPIFVVDNQIKKFLEIQYTTKSNENTFNNKEVFFQTQPKLNLNLRHLLYCKNNNIVVAFSSFKIGRFFSCKDSIPKFHESYIVYQFTCAGCKVCYISETKHHLKTKFEEHLGKDRNSQILKHVQENSHSGQVSNFDCFKVIDQVNSHFRLQLKEVMRLN